MRKYHHAPPIMYSPRMGVVGSPYETYQDQCIVVEYHEGNDRQAEAREDMHKFNMWCRQNCKDDWIMRVSKSKSFYHDFGSRFSNQDQEVTVVEFIDRLMISFENPRDAVLFKMFTQ